jgi:O-acetyl-ADP-ribose deacetylase (regulator of RNase III)
LTANSRTVKEATESALLLADKLGAASITFPALGTGVGGFPLDECAQIMLGRVQKLSGKLANLGKVLFVLFDTPSCQAFEKELQSLSE